MKKIFFILCFNLIFYAFGNEFKDFLGVNMGDSISTVEERMKLLGFEVDEIRPYYTENDEKNVLNKDFQIQDFHINKSEEWGTLYLVMIYYHKGKVYSISLFYDNINKKYRSKVKKILKNIKKEYNIISSERIGFYKSADEKFYISYPDPDTRWRFETFLIFDISDSNVLNNNCKNESLTYKIKDILSKNSEYFPNYK